MSNFSFATDFNKENKQKKKQKTKTIFRIILKFVQKKKPRHFSYSSFSPPPLKLQRHNP